MFRRFLANVKFTFTFIGMVGRAIRAVLIALLVEWGLWRKPPTMADLKFPVVMTRGRENPTPPITADTLEELQRVSPGPAYAGAEKSVIIDSDLKLYTVHHARSHPGELVHTFLYMINASHEMTYSLTLKRRWRNGMRPARRHLLSCETLDRDASISSRKRDELAAANNFAEMRASLKTEPAVALGSTQESIP